MFSRRVAAFLLRSMRGFDIAKEEGLPVDNKVLLKMLENFPSDDNWDETDPRQKSFKECGEMRYYYRKQQLNCTEVKVATNRKVETTSELKAPKVAFHLLDKETEASSSSVVKAEPGFADFQKKCEDFDKARKLLQGKEQLVKDLAAQLKFKASNDSSYQDKSEEFNRFAAKLSDKLSEARALSVEAGACLGQKTIDDNILKRCIDQLPNLEADAVTVAAHSKRIKAMLE